jgi:hypothetical protein
VLLTKGVKMLMIVRLLGLFFGLCTLATQRGRAQQTRPAPVAPKAATPTSILGVYSCENRRFPWGEQAFLEIQQDKLFMTIGPRQATCPYVLHGNQLEIFCASLFQARSTTVEVRGNKLFMSKDDKDDFCVRDRSSVGTTAIKYARARMLYHTDSLAGLNELRLKEVIEQFFSTYTYKDGSFAGGNIPFGPENGANSVKVELRRNYTLNPALSAATTDVEFYVNYERPNHTGAREAIIDGTLTLIQTAGGGWMLVKMQAWPGGHHSRVWEPYVLIR